MDGHHHMPPHGHESSSYQNGYNAADEFGNILSNGGSNDNYGGWGFDAASHIPNQNAQSDPYLAWQPSHTGLENFNPQAFTKSSSNLQTVPFAGYGNNHQYSHSTYDPSLGSTTTNGPSAYDLGHSPYGQPQPIQHGTIAPQALEHERAHVRTSQTLDPQSYPRAGTVEATSFAKSIPQAPPADQVALHSAIPAGTRVGNFWMKDPDRLLQATNSTQVTPYLSVGKNEVELSINRATVQTPARRLSRKQLAERNPKLKAKFERPRVPKALSAGSGQPSKSMKQEHSNSESDTSESDSDSESDGEPEASPLPAQRPEDPRGGVEYDTMKALWESSHTGVAADRIRTGMVEFNDVVQTIKNRLKADTNALTEAVDRKKNSEVPLLKSRVNDQLELLKVALQTAIEHGNRDILSQLGQHSQLMATIASLLIDRYKASDFNGPVTRLIFEVLVRCDNLSAQTYSATKLQKCITMINNKGNIETREICDRIHRNVTGAPMKQPSSELQSGVKSPPSNRPTPEPVAGVKRAAPGSISSDPSSKRVLVTPGAGHAVSNGASKTSMLKRALPVGSNIKPGIAAKPPLGTTVKAKASATKQITSAATGAGVKKAVTKTATPSVVAAAIKSIEKKAAPAAPAKPAFSFAETMANLNKSKEKQPTPLKAEEKQAPETVEEKAKRERKEERRKLRVKFKPDSQLVETRIFHHDVDEELGHDASMIRDVSDVGGEGRMFKQHKDMMDIDEDDENAVGEENFGAYVSPTLTDFSSVELEERKRNYSPYGGGELEPESAERIKREQYEASTLMVFYTDTSDIPSCPREPADPYNGEEIITKAFGPLGTQEPLATRIAKLAGPVQPVQPQQSSAAPDISAILALINPQGQAPLQPAQSQPAQAPVPVSAPSQNQDQMAEIQRILASIPQAPTQQQQSQPVQTQQPAQQPAQPTMAADLAGIFANLNPQAQTSNIFPPVQHPAMDPNPAAFAALFSQLNQGQNGGQGANFNQFPYPGAGFNMPNMGNYPGQQQNQQSPYENEERRRWRDGGGGGGGGDNSSDHSRRGKPGKKGSTFTDKRFTVPCKYFKKGQCQKGDSCTYRHEY